MLAEILGPDLLIIGGIIVVLFGGSQLPKLARSLGKAKTEFSKGLAEGDKTDADTKGDTAPRAEVGHELTTRATIVIADKTSVTQHSYPGSGTSRASSAFRIRQKRVPSRRPGARTGLA